ncbi:MAG: TetR/AcrR family transcriptional regulator [Candidatus Odinarchaeota archaeon]
MKDNKILSRKEKEIENRKKYIIDTAERLFKSKGFDNTTMDEIAAESEFSKGTLYKYFNSKDDLYIAIGIKAYELIIKYTKDFTEKENPGIKQLMAVGYAYYEFSKKNPSYTSIFHDIAMKFPEIVTKSEDERSEIEQEYFNISQLYGSLFIKILQDAMKAKAIRSDKNPNMIGFVLSRATRVMVEELVQNESIITKFKLKKDEIINFFFEILGEGLKPRDK